ncbi:hypothetical protein WJX74_009516 [Apatococcus lobatus]|uniref:AAA+ ATPase domain-containing protein n=1 Tax=Apatococcus lobatus TaxID=904363 RepID=A0AAW1RRR4_9CHLO
MSQPTRQHCPQQQYQLHRSPQQQLPSLFQALVYCARTARCRPEVPCRAVGLGLSSSSLCSHQQAAVCLSASASSEEAGDLGNVEGLTSEEDGTVMVRDDLDALLQVLPLDIRQPLTNHPDRPSLLEVILDLGRRPEARFLGKVGGQYLRENEITWEDLAAAEAAVGEFGGDNRAGVQGTLHRISAIRNRKDAIIGLTCRVGRAVTGHLDMMRDLMPVASSILFLGRPGVGKTTVIREMARTLADELHKRVVIVDTSNEIGGDGDVPHPAIGSARRMPVPDPSLQHRVMIEAVENHMPEVVIVDEVGTEAEALACRSIAERGVQLVATAHGRILENIIKNPTLCDLVGGIQSVTLGDDEARQRGTQKSILERRAPPTFPVLIEMRERTDWVTHWTQDSVDCLLQHRMPVVQVRRRDAQQRRVIVAEAKYDPSDEAMLPPGQLLAPSPSSSGSSSSSSKLGPARPSSSPRSSASGSFSSISSESSMDEDLPQQSRTESSTSTDGGDAEDPYAWAKSMKNVQEEEALRGLAILGYSTEVQQPRPKYNFSGGTGTGRRNKRRGSKNVDRTPTFNFN